MNQTNLNQQNDKNSNDKVIDKKNPEFKKEIKSTSQETSRQDRFKKNNNRKNNDKRPRRSILDLEFEEKVVEIKRVTNVTKGGRRFSFSAYVVIGNKKGRVGLGHGKANEVPDAIKKAVINAKKNLVNVPLIDRRTIPHEQKAKFLSSSVIIKPAPQGKGLVAGGAVRPLVELAGYKDIYTKTFGSRTKVNTMKATLKALQNLRTWERIKTMRGIIKPLVKTNQGKG